MLEDSCFSKDTNYMKMCITVEPWYKEPLYNGVLGTMSYFLTPVTVKYMAIWNRTSLSSQHCWHDGEL